MKLRFGILTILLFAVFAHEGRARAETIFFNGFGSGAIDIFETAETGAQFYGRRNFPTFPVNSNGLNFYFHRDTNTGVLSLGIIVDDRGDGTGGNLSGTITGLGPGASVAFADDAGEISITAPGVAVFNYNWVSCCTDGGIITGLDADNLNFTINITSASGLTGTYLIDPSGTTQIAGAPAIGASLTVAANPEPSTWALFILGFFGCAFAMKQRRRDLRRVIRLEPAARSANH
ncbi:MAG: PEP-CTERM sorting domain-containing protein [Pseudomonadota bacterium]